MLEVYFTLLDWILAIGIIFGSFYLFATWNYDYFKKRNVNAAKPVPFFGNFCGLLFDRTSFAETMQDLYNLFPEDKFIGFFELRKPSLMIRDPELIKQITITDYEYFLNHIYIADEKVDSLFSRHLYILKDQKWKDMRMTLSPAFSSSKMRGMYSMIDDCANQVMAYIDRETKKGCNILDLTDTFSRFANDVIATSAFGVKTDSLNNKNNKFYKMGQLIRTPSLIQRIKCIAYSASPSLMKHLQLTLYDDVTSTFFRNLTKETIESRKKDNVHRPDMVHLLMEARKGLLQPETYGSDAEGYAAVPEHLPCDGTVPKRELTDDDITAQCILFFLIGFATASNLMGLVAYELTINEDVQRKLQAEIDQVKEQHKTINYDVIHNLKYLDMVISETLRKWPPMVALDRSCGKPYTLSDGKISIEMNPGDSVVIPVYGLHRDPKHFPNPDKFDPERFNNENIRNIKPGTYLPFGSGARNCMASRFVLMETKAIIFHLLANFNLKICSKTQIPMKLSKKSYPFTLDAEKGYWTEIQRRILT